ARRARQQARSDLKQLGFLVLEQLVDLRYVGASELVELPFGPTPLVFARIAALDQLVQRIFSVPADIADRDPAVLRLMPSDLDVFAAALLGELRKHHPDDRAVVGRVHTKVAVADRLFDRAKRRLVKGLDHYHPGLGDVKRSQLV